MHVLSGTRKLPVTHATITWSQRGPWVADLGLEAATPPEGEVTLEEGAVRLRGWATNPATFAGRASVRVVGGRGALSTAVQPRQYRGAPLSLVLGDLGTDSGEAMGATTTEVGSQVIQNWARPGASPTRALDELVAAMGADYGWRVSDSGKVLLGPEAWPTVTPRRAKVLDEDPATGVLTADDEGLELRPGTTWDGRRLTTVQVQWSAAKTRTRVWVLRGAARSLGDALARAVEARLPSPLWTRHHPCRVFSQDADRTLQLIPDDPAVPPLVGVPLRTGIPGLDVEVNPGARVQLAFEEGDPRRPMAIPAFDRDLGALKSLRITADTEITVDAPSVKVCGDGGVLDLGDTPTNPVHRVGDLVQMTMALIVPDPTQGIMLTSPVGPVTGTIGTPVLPVIVVGQAISGKAGVRA